MDTSHILSMLLTLIYMVLAGIILICIIYASARAGALAWYRTKLEHFKRVLHITKGE